MKPEVIEALLEASGAASKTDIAFIQQCLESIGDGAAQCILKIFRAKNAVNLCKHILKEHELLESLSVRRLAEWSLQRIKDADKRAAKVHGKKVMRGVFENKKGLFDAKFKDILIGHFCCAKSAAQAYDNYLRQHGLSQEHPPNYPQIGDRGFYKTEPVYRGVVRARCRTLLWDAVGPGNVPLGRFTSKESAAKAYDEHCKSIGVAENLNFPESVCEE